MMDVDICHLALQKVMIQIIPTGQDRWEWAHIALGEM